MPATIDLTDDGGAHAVAPPGTPVALEPAGTVDGSVLAAGRRHFAGARGLAVNGGALVVNVLASALTGLGFWIIAARVAPPSVVAQSSAAITAILAVVSLAQQSFVLTLPSLLSVSPEPRRLTASMYRAALVMTAITAPLYVLLGPRLADGLEFLRDWRLAVAFLVGTLVWCIFSLQDAVLTGVRKAKYVLFENATWGIIRLLGLIGLWAAGAHLGVGLVIMSWVVPAAGLVAVVNWYLFRSQRSPLAEARGTQSLDRRRFLSYMGAEFLASVLSSAMTLVVGAYILTTLGASAAAPLLTAASLMLVVEGTLASFAQALSVEASRPDGAHERRHSLIHMTAIFLGALSLGAIVTAAIAGDQIMALLGPHYRETGGTALAILMLSVPFRSILVVSNADNRIRGEGGRNLIQQAVASVVCVCLLVSGQFTTVAALAWIPVIIRAATAVVAGVQLGQGRLKLHHSPA